MYQYQLEDYKGRKSRHTCPSCGHKNEFTLYVHKDTGKPLASNVGICNRINNCGHHYSPKEYFKDNGITKEQYSFVQNTALIPIKTIEFLPRDYLADTLHHYDKNNFFIYLKCLFTIEIAQHLCLKYLVGTSRYWKGATIFWQKDTNGRFRQCKLMLFDARTGRRVRNGVAVEKFNPISFKYERTVVEQDCVKVYGKYLSTKTRDLNLIQCFFGEHLLAEHPDAIIGIVESEKAAIIASVYFPKMVWIATGGKHGCKWYNKEVFKVLKNRRVILFPDVGVYRDWKKKADDIKQQINCKIHVYDVFEKNATIKQKGWDLADYLLKSRDEVTGLATVDGLYPICWDYQINAFIKI